MSRESVACVTRTFTCDRRLRSSSWLEIGSLVMSFKICPCRNRFCAFNPMGSIIYRQLHNYAVEFRCLSIHFFDFSKIIFFEEFRHAPLMVQLTCGVAPGKISLPTDYDAHLTTRSNALAGNRALRR